MVEKIELVEISAPPILEQKKRKQEQNKFSLIRESAQVQRQSDQMVVIEPFDFLVVLEFRKNLLCLELTKLFPREIPELKLTFDNGNAFTGEDPAESFRLCAADVVHAHFKDWELCTGGLLGLDGRSYRGALIGEGMLDQRSCLAAMKKAGYTGYINIEYEGDKYDPEEATRRAADHMNKLMAELE